jgi:hypothetical protein
VVSEGAVFERAGQDSSVGSASSGGGGGGGEVLLLLSCRQPGLSGRQQLGKRERGVVVMVARLPQRRAGGSLGWRNERVDVCARGAAAAAAAKPMRT